MLDLIKQNRELQQQLIVSNQTINNNTINKNQKFNSADDYAMIKEGKKYKVYGYWFRLPLMSWN